VSVAVRGSDDRQAYQQVWHDIMTHRPGTGDAATWRTVVAASVPGLVMPGTRS
jgi:hypothetical protein